MGQPHMFVTEWGWFLLRGWLSLFLCREHMRVFVYLRRGRIEHCSLKEKISEWLGKLLIKQTGMTGTLLTRKN